MKKVINGKLYDTDTAKFLGDFDNGKFTNDFSYLYEGLYQKRTGEHFLHCVGGELTTYHGSLIKPLTYEEAKKWAEEHLTGDEYVAIFGEPGEDDNARLSLHLSAAAVARLKREAAIRGWTISAVVEDLIAQSL